MSGDPFSPVIHHLAECDLHPMHPGAAHALAPAIAAIPPWSVMGYPAGALMANLMRPDPAARRFAVLRDGAPIGAIVIRHPWLQGPYLEHAALLPPHQGKGIGGALLDWMERQARPAGARFLWLVVSSFNTRAAVFYERHGFRRIAVLEDLVCDGFDEILMRKRL